MSNRSPSAKPFPVPIGRPPFNDAVSKSCQHESARRIKRYAGRLIEGFEAADHREQFRTLERGSRFFFFSFQVDSRFRGLQQESPAIHGWREAADRLFVRRGWRSKGLSPEQAMGTTELHGRGKIPAWGRPSMQLLRGGSVKPRANRQCDILCYRRTLPGRFRTIHPRIFRDCFHPARRAV